MTSAFFGIIIFSYLFLIASAWGSTNEPRKPRTVWTNTFLTMFACIYIFMTSVIYWDARS